MSQAAKSISPPADAAQSCRECGRGGRPMSVTVSGGRGDYLTPDAAARFGAALRRRLFPNTALRIAVLARYVGTGVSRQTVYDWINGVRAVSLLNYDNVRLLMDESFALEVFPPPADARVTLKRNRVLKLISTAA